MKVLISSCIMGNNVRWNGANKLDKNISTWAADNNIELVPICPEAELFGTPRKSIRLLYADNNIQAVMGEKDVMPRLDNKCSDLLERHADAVGFVGIAGSPTCGISVGVKFGGFVTKGSFHKLANIPTTEISAMKTDSNRKLFLRRLRKHADR